MRIIVTIIALLFVSWQADDIYIEGKEINDSCLVYILKSGNSDTVCFSGGILRRWKFIKIYDDGRLIQVLPGNWCITSTVELTRTIIFKQ